MSAGPPPGAGRRSPAAGEGGAPGPVLVLAPLGRDAALAAGLLAEAGIAAEAQPDARALLRALPGAGAAVVTEEALADPADLRGLAAWVGAQPPWSDFPFVALTRRGAGGAEREPAAARLTAALGNASFLERPFHPTTMVSLARAALAGRARQLQARDALAQAAATAERLRFAMEAGRLGAWELDAGTWTLTASDACRAVFGRAPGAAFSYADLLAAVHPEDRGRTRAAVAAALAGDGDGAYGVEYRTVWPDGTRHWAEVRGRAVRPAGGGPARMTGVALDTTARRAGEEALRAQGARLEAMVAERTGALEAANRRLREAAEERERAEAALLQAQKMEAVGQLTGGLAHDFNNLLQAVLASLDLIRRRAGDPAAVARLADAGSDAARRGARLTAQLLAFSRTQRLELAPVRLGPLVAGMRDLLERSLGPRVAVRLDADGAGEAAALADATQVELALLNLAINARDAMPGGGTVTVAARAAAWHPARPELPAGFYASVAVSDTGEGMPPEVAARAFEPFFTTKGVGKGTGLGLSQVYGIARQSGGGARIETAPGRGTTVTILLPVAGETAAAAAAAARPVSRPVPEAEAGASPAAPPDAARPGRLVLVVDDDPDVRRALVGWVEALGYRAAEAAHGRAGLEALSALSPDLLLVDHAMPGMTGAEVAAEATRRRPGLPVVLATGYAEDAAMAAGSAARWPVLRKPFRLEDLSGVLARALAGADAR